MLAVSFAGPISNLLLAFVSALLMGILIKLNLLSGCLLQVLRYTYIYNLIFAVFNLIPIPPLDGSKVLMSLLPGRQAYALERIEPYGSFILITLVYLDIINSITSPIINLISLIMQHIINIIL
jgi:Zn-dependent protease